MADYSASIEIAAPVEAVFRHLTTAEAMVTWMGQYARLDPVAGGEFTVDIDGSPVRGRYLVVEPPTRVVVSWGIAGADDHPPGSSQVEFTLSRTAAGTHLELRHTSLPERRADGHRRGWERFLANLADTTARSSTR